MSQNNPLKGFEIFGCLIVIGFWALVATTFYAINWLFNHLNVSISFH